MLGDSTTIRQRTAPFGRFVPPRVPPLPAVGVALGILASLVAGWAAAGGHMLFAAPFVAAAVVVIFVRSPQVPFAAILFFASTFAVAYTLPKAGPLYPAEAALLLGLAALPLIRTAAFGGAVGTFLVIFLGAIGIGIVVASGHGVSFHTALLTARTPVLYASFWIALSAIRANRRRFLLVVGVTAVAISLLSLAQYLLPGHTLFRSGGSSVVTSDNGFLRVRPPGLLLVYFGSIFTLTYLFWGPKRRRLQVLVLGGLFATAILISLNRNMLVGLTAGLVIALVVLPRRTGAATRLVAVGVAAVSIALLSGGGAVIQRIVSLGNVSYLQRTTLADRQYEDVFARATIARHPLSGIGWGVSYGANVRTTGRGSSSHAGSCTTSTTSSGCGWGSSGRCPISCCSELPALRGSGSHGDRVEKTRGSAPESSPRSSHSQRARSSASTCSTPARRRPWSPLLALAVDTLGPAGRGARRTAACRPALGQLTPPRGSVGVTRPR